MKADTRKTGFRLRTARGHLDAVVRMVDDDRYCIDVLHQLSAVQGSLEGVKRDIIEAHLQSCLPEAVASGRMDDIVEELMAAVFGAAPGRKAKAKAHACHTDTQKISAAPTADTQLYFGAGI
ncbi:metal-sensitive transcriptional regulator [Demequina sp. SO4-13]|uniref:metal-sensitive transcriptional regulator n=1 Tax=Demequina sp. SO4-13 TaxID=3401027 RepID=UPI003AF8D444